MLEPWESVHTIRNERGTDRLHGHGGDVTTQRTPTQVYSASTQAALASDTLSTRLNPESSVAAQACVNTRSMAPATAGEVYANVSSLNRLGTPLVVSGQGRSTEQGFPLNSSVPMDRLGRDGKRERVLVRYDDLLVWLQQRD